jgi:hypothetical protein
MRHPLMPMAFLVMSIAVLVGASLPIDGPVPPPAPRAEDASRNSSLESPASPAQPKAVPVPASKPDAARTDKAAEKPASPASSTPPALSEKQPLTEHLAKDRDLGGSEALATRSRSEIATEEPEAFAACISALKAIGAGFLEIDRIEDGQTCGIDKPIELDTVLPGIRLEPKGILRCETALQLARMTRDMLKPAADAAFPDRPKLTAIRQASTYVCRKRNSADDGKVSEHAYGNAIDLAGLRFGNEEMPVMIARQDDGTAEAAFQRAFNAIACLYFTTVLSPGSDTTHQDHMHLDVITRKNGFRYCR